MGAWDVGIFDDDAALDFIYELEGAGDLSPVARVITDVLEMADDYIEAPEGSQLLAGAEAVALVAGVPAQNLPESLTDWQRDNQPAIHDDIVLDNLIQAVEIVLTAENSELRELWEEAEENYTNWQATVQDLLGRLRQINQTESD